MKKLNFGCGSIQPEGWVNYDKEDFGQKKTPEGVKHPDMIDESFDMIVAHCAIQINEFHYIPQLLKDLKNLLKPGGVLRISLPDIEEGFRQYAAGNIDWFPNGEEDIHIRFSAWLTWYSTTKTLLTPEALAHILLEVGFSDVRKAGFGLSWFDQHGITQLDTRENECYFVEARK